MSFQCRMSLVYILYKTKNEIRKLQKKVFTNLYQLACNTQKGTFGHLRSVVLDQPVLSVQANPRRHFYESIRSCIKVDLL